MVGAACGLPVKFDPRLRETHLGLWQGRTVAEIDRDYPGAIAAWRSDPTWAPPGGESRVAVVARSRPVVDELDAEFADSGRGPRRRCLLVAHGGLIAGLVTGLLELPTEVWPSFGGFRRTACWAVLARREATTAVAAWPVTTSGPDPRRWRRMRTDMEGGRVKGQGEAVSMTVVVDTASVPGYCVGGGERVGDRRVVSLICAGWLPQDGRFGW